MALQRAVYRPRDAEHTVLHQVIAEHLEVFLHAVAEAGDGAGLPQFMEREFREFLTCGVFEHGVARFRCEGCAHEHLVPFSCKGRAAPGPAGVRVWAVMSRGCGPRVGCPPPESVDAAYPPVHKHFFLPQNRLPAKHPKRGRPLQSIDTDVFDRAWRSRSYI